jgi:hypothetical protein
VRRARTTTGTGVLCARYMCPRAVEAPGACARGSGVEKMRTVPCAALQRRPAGARRRRQRQPSGLRDARPRREPDGGHSAPAPGAARPRGARWAPPARRGRPDVSLAVGPRGAAGAARARPRRRQRARGACWRAFCCGMWGCARPLTGVVCCCCALLRRAGFRNVADEQQRRQWGRDLPIILPVGARRVHCLNPFQQHGAMTGVGSGALAL